MSSIHSKIINSKSRNNHAHYPEDDEASDDGNTVEVGGVSVGAHAVLVRKIIRFVFRGNIANVLDILRLKSVSLVQSKISFLKPMK